MAFILSAQRELETVVSAFENYRKYVLSHADEFPPGVFALASSDWYFDPRESRCPHDAWLETIFISEPSTGTRNENRSTDIKVKLRGACHDGFIDLSYSNVQSYSLTSPFSEQGLGDWLYDEFRISPNGLFVHEIEWAGFSDQGGSRWLIEASEIEFRWTPA